MGLAGVQFAQQRGYSSWRKLDQRRSTQFEVSDVESLLGFKEVGTAA